MKAIFKITFWSSAFGLLLITSCNASDIDAKDYVSVASATSFRMLNSGVTMHLYGVEGCALDQRAFYNHIPWPCGAVAIGWLTQQTLGSQITCMTIKDAGYAAYAARCFLPDGSDLAAKALTEGMLIGARVDGALIDPSYAPYERDAKARRKGLWSSSFQLKDRLFNEAPDE